MKQSDVPSRMFEISIPVKKSAKNNENSLDTDYIDEFKSLLGKSG